MPRKKKTDEQKQAEKSAASFAKLAKTPQLVKGMKDLLPVDQPYWDYIRSVIRNLGRIYGFSRIDTPVVEATQLFTHGLGKQTDVVEKEMYTFIDEGGDSLTLRPEFTAGITRAYIEHGMWNMVQPIKMYTMGPLFRRERPQADRYRQHHQFNCEILGESTPAVDAQLILVAYKFYEALGLPVLLHINSIGDLASRVAYKEVLTEYYKAKRSQLCENCKRRLTRNPLRLLDCKDVSCQPIKENAPQLVDHLTDESKEHFMKVLEFLDELEIPYHLDSYLVRGLDYYTHTVFEFFLVQDDDQTSPVTLGGGGRYDNLAEVLGGQSTPACGFGLGIERAINRMKLIEEASETSLVPDQRTPNLFLAQLGEQAKRAAMVLYEDLIREGFNIVEGFAKDSLKAQLEMANKLGVKFTLILGAERIT